MFRFAGFELDTQRAELRGPDGGAIKLRPKTFEMLRLFAGNAGRVLSKQDLMETVWPKVHVGEDSLFQCIRELRAALGDHERQLIKVISGRGYLFDVKVSTEPASFAVRREVAADVAPEIAEVPIKPAPSRRRLFGLRWPAATAVAGGLCAIIGLAVAAPAFRTGLVSKDPTPVIAVMPIADASGESRGAAMAAGATDRLIDGFAKIGNIKVIAPSSNEATIVPQWVSAPSAPTNFVVRGELRREGQSWTLRARMIKAATDEVQAVVAVAVDFNEPDAQLQQSRLAAGVGHPLARRLNELLQAGNATPDADSNIKVAIEQAMASINQTSRERFGVAQTMLQKALAANPENIDLAMSLAALQLRGIQMVWYSLEDAATAEAQASAVLERAQRVKPNSIAVHETSCRLLSATNRFAESLVACAKVLSFDPWDGMALYLVGLDQIFLGRFEDALSTFRLADRYDTPQVSRWTWLLGAGWAQILLERDKDALPWLQRSIAITPATGRTHMLLASAYQQLGRIDEAKAAMQKGLELRPGTTALNVSPPTKNVSPVLLKAAERILQNMIAAGLPER